MERVECGNGVFLRLLTEDDIDDRYLSWFQDDNVTAFLESKNLSRDDAVQFLRWGQEIGRRIQFAICDLETGRLVGTVKLGDIYFKSMVSDLVTVIGDRQFWGRGIATTAIKAVGEIAFSQYGIRKLHGAIYSNNLGSLKAYLRAGWLVEAVMYADAVGPDGLNDRIVVSRFNPVFHPVLPTFPLPFPQV